MAELNNGGDRPVIEFRNVVKSFGSQKVLDGVNVSFPTGKTTVIAGGSGQGKSVTLKLILGLLSPDSGEILVDGVNIVGMSRSRLNQVREKFGVLFQGAALLDSLPVFDNIALPLVERTALSAREVRAEVDDVLARLDLVGHEDKFPAQLSGGMRKRVGLARAMMMKPAVMLFDEPTTGLDPRITLDIYRLFFRIQQQLSYTSIIVSHDIPRVFNLADRVLMLNQGKMRFYNSPEEIQLDNDPAVVDFTRETMGEIYYGGNEE